MLGKSLPKQDLGKKLVERHYQSTEGLEGETVGILGGTSGPHKLLWVVTPGIVNLFSARRVTKEHCFCPCHTQPCDWACQEGGYYAMILLPFPNKESKGGELFSLMLK